MTGSLALSLEARRAGCTASVAAELTIGEVPTSTRSSSGVEAINADDIARVIDRVLRRGARTLAVVGPSPRNSPTDSVAT